MTEGRSIPLPEAAPAAPAVPAPPAESRELFAAEETSKLRGRWSDIQGGFVDQPRRAVQDADALVTDVVKRLTDTFARERNSLEQQWDHGENASTEDLRIALQRYRAFFDRLLSV
jgi:hypothetical protein